jgi:hypothetical protein
MWHRLELDYYQVVPLPVLPVQYIVLVPVLASTSTVSIHGY